MYIGIHVNYPFFLSDSLDRFWKKKNSQISNFMEICPVGPELSHADRRTDRTKLIVALRSFASAPKNWNHAQQATFQYVDYSTFLIPYFN